MWSMPRVYEAIGEVVMLKDLLEGGAAGPLSSPTPTKSGWSLRPSRRRLGLLRGQAYDSAGERVGHRLNDQGLAGAGPPVLQDPSAA